MYYLQQTRPTAKQHFGKNQHLLINVGISRHIHSSIFSSFTHSFTRFLRNSHARAKREKKSIRVLNTKNVIKKYWLVNRGCTLNLLFHTRNAMTNTRNATMRIVNMSKFGFSAQLPVQFTSQHDTDTHVTYTQTFYCFYSSEQTYTSQKSSWNESTHKQSQMVKRAIIRKKTFDAICSQKCTSDNFQN